MYRHHLPLVGLSVCLCALMGASTAAHANVYGFHGITNNHPSSTAVGEQQLWMAVEDAGPGQVLFTFHNSGEVESVLTRIFLEEGVLSGLDSILEQPAPLPGSLVNFTPDLKVGNLPGGNSLPLKFAEAFSVSADSPGPFNGINSGPLAGDESVGLLFDLKPGFALTDVLAGLNDGTFRVGVHVQAIFGNSEAFVNNRFPRPVPEPATVGLLATSLCALLVVRRKRA